MGQVSAHWSKHSARNSFIRVGSGGRGTVVGGWQLSLWLSLKFRVFERLVCNSCYTLVMIWGPINHKESFWAGIFFCKVYSCLLLAFCM